MSSTNETIDKSKPGQGYYTLAAVTESKETISFLDIYRFFVKYLKTIGSSIATITILALIYALFIAKPVFVSTSTLLPSSGNDAFSEMVGLASQFGINIPSSTDAANFSTSEMYVKILQSRTLASSLLDKNFDTEAYGPQTPLVQILTYGDDEPEYGIDTLREMSINILLEDVIRVIEDRNSQLLTIEVRTSEPALSAALNNEVLLELNKLQKKFDFKNISEQRTFIENRTKTVERELAESEEKLRIFRERNRQISNSPVLMLEEDRLTREIDVQTGVFTTLKQQLEMAKIELIQTESMIQILDPPNIPLENDEPNIPLILIAGLMLGAIFGITLSLFQNMLANSGQQIAANSKVTEVTRL